MNIDVLFAFVMGHDKLKVITTIGHMKVRKHSSLLGLVKAFPGLLQNVRVGAGVPHIAPHICLDHA